MKMGKIPVVDTTGHEKPSTWYRVVIISDPSAPGLDIIEPSNLDHYKKNRNFSANMPAHMSKLVDNYVVAKNVTDILAQKLIGKLGETTITLQSVSYYSSSASDVVTCNQIHLHNMIFEIFHNIRWPLFCANFGTTKCSSPS